MMTEDLPEQQQQSPSSAYFRPSDIMSLIYCNICWKHIFYICFKRQAFFVIVAASMD